jgi:hypothetical protein
MDRGTNTELELVEIVNHDDELSWLIKSLKKP